MAELQLSIDEALRNDAQTVATNLGLDLATAVRMFLVQMVRKGGLPFKVKADPFFSPANQQYLERINREVLEGKNVAYHDMIEV